MGKPHYGMRKPELGAQLDMSHPFGRDACVVVPFNEDRGTPAVLFGNASRPPSSVLLPNTTVLPVWNSNREGIAAQCPSTSGGGWDFNATGTVWVPSAAITIAYIRRKLDTTNRNAAVFTGMAVGGWGSASSCLLLTPYGDGTCYWDFGGASGVNRLTAAGLTFSTTVPERWVITAGPLGSAIWQNGIKVASQATAISRTADSTIAALNNSQVIAANAHDIVEFNFFQVSAAQWSDDLCRWWSAEPYAHLIPQTTRKYLFLGIAGQSLGSGRLTSLGVG